MCIMTPSAYPGLTMDRAGEVPSKIPHGVLASQEGGRRLPSFVKQMESKATRPSEKRAR